MQSILLRKMRGQFWSESRHFVADLSELRDFVASELNGQMMYLEARELDEAKTLASHFRLSADDLTDDDFQWLTASVRNEVRAVRA